MLYQFIPLAGALGLLLGILVCLELGFRLARERDRVEGARSGVGVVDGAMFALLGLLIAFTFSGSSNRFDERRDLITREATAVGTAYLRIDVLPDTVQAGVRRAFLDYVDMRLAAYGALPDVEAALARLTESTRLQAELWSIAVGATRAADPGTRRFLLEALNEAFDAAGERTMVLRAHTPIPIFALLFAISFICALLAGGAMGLDGSRHWLHRIGFALVTSVTVFLILELELPRVGFIRVDGADRNLIEVRAGMR